MNFDAKETKAVSAIGLIFTRICTAGLLLHDAVSFFRKVLTHRIITNRNRPYYRFSQDASFKKIRYTQSHKKVLVCVKYYNVYSSADSTKINCIEF